MPTPHTQHARNQARNQARNRAALALLLALGTAACGATATGTDGGDPDAATSPAHADAARTDAPAADAADAAPFQPAEHGPLTQIESNGGPTMSHVQLVVITYSDDTNVTDLDAFGQWIGGSSWLTTVGAEYGVGAGTLLGTVHRTDPAPDAITSTELEAMISAGVADGSLPSPPDHNYSNVLYMVFFPAHTTVTLLERGQPAGQSCADFGGYHSEINRTGGRLAYAAIPDCGADRTGSDVTGMTLAASHEYIEAATDPYPFSRPGYQLVPDGSSAWAFIGGEVGDLCELSHSALQDGPYVVTRVWSNAAASAGTDPCIPADTTRPYFNVAFDTGDVQFAQPGDTVTFHLTGFSLTPIAPWQLSIAQMGGNLRLTPTLSTTSISNGRSATITVRVPTTATSGYASFVVQSVESSPRARQVWPMAVVIQ